MVTLLALLQPEYSFTLLPPTVRNFASLIQHRQRCRNQYTRPRNDCTVPPVWYSWMHCLQNPFEKQKNHWCRSFVSTNKIKTPTGTNNHTRLPITTQHWHTGCKSDAPFGAPLRRVLFTCQVGDDPSAKRRRTLHNEPLLPGVYIYTLPHKEQINLAYRSKYFAIKSSTVRQYSVGATEDESAWPAPSTVSSSFSQAAAAYNSPSILYGTSSSDEP